MTPGSRANTRRDLLFGWFGLAVLTILVSLHMVSCVPGLHESASSGGGHHLSVPAHLDLLGAVADCGTDRTAFAGSSAVREAAGHGGDGHRHASCPEDGELGLLDGGIRSPSGAALAVVPAVVSPDAAEAGRETAGGRGSPPAEKLPAGHWIRHRLRGATLPAALGVSRT